MSNYMVLTLLHLISWKLLLTQAHHEDRAGFISIDCGSSDSSYTDEETEITYFNDKNFISSGVNKEISAPNRLLTGEKQFWNVRSFPQGTRNCYTLQPSGVSGTRYLIRARFMYGNYDSINRVPKFDLYIGIDFWEKVDIAGALDIVSTEVLHVLSSDHINVCLVSTGFGVPFISVLELRPLKTGIYGSGAAPLVLTRRFDFGSETNQTKRYVDDPYDRLWSPFPGNSWISVNTSVGEDNLTQNDYGVPYPVMSTAYTNNESIKILGHDLNTTAQFYFFLHLAELVKLEANKSREFNMYINGILWHGPFVPTYLKATTLSSRDGTIPDADGYIQILFNKTENSTLQPLLNALEIYMFLDNNPGLETFQSDVTAMIKIKLAYELEKINWQGDPCAPKDYIWEGIDCTYSSNSPPRITYLNLSSSGLVGEISPSFANLTKLQYLDLSNNSLTGTLPNFFAQMPNLKILNLKGNNLDGPVPPALLRRANNGLSLSVDDNVMGNEPPPSPTPSSNGNSSSDGFICGKNKIVAAVAASLLGGLVTNLVL